MLFLVNYRYCKFMDHWLYLLVGVLDLAIGLCMHMHFMNSMEKNGTVQLPFKWKMSVKRIGLHMVSCVCYFDVAYLMLKETR